MVEDEVSMMILTMVSCSETLPVLAMVIVLVKYLCLLTQQLCCVQKELYNSVMSPPGVTVLNKDML